MITLEEAQRRQDELQAQGHRLLSSIPILDLFNRYGAYQTGGSFRHGLMLAAKADIDGYIICHDPSLELSLKLFEELITSEFVRRVALDKGDGNSLQVKVPFEGRLWNFDVHFATEKTISQLDYLGQQNFTETQRQSMLLLKAQLQERGLYPGSSKLPGSLSSIDVYRAVLEYGVKDIDEIIAWSQERQTEADIWRKQH